MNSPYSAYGSSSPQSCPQCAAAQGFTGFPQQTPAARQDTFAPAAQSPAAGVLQAGKAAQPGGMSYQWTGIQQPPSASFGGAVQGGLPAQQQTSPAAAQTGLQPSAMIPSSVGITPSAPQGAMQGSFSPITDLSQPMPITTESLQYLNGFMRTQIGRRVQVQFLLGTNTITDRTGTLLGVGANYILLNETDSDDLLACDFYNIKFIRIYY